MFGLSIVGYCRNIVVHHGRLWKRANCLSTGTAGPRIVAIRKSSSLPSVHTSRWTQVAQYLFLMLNLIAQQLKCAVITAGGLLFVFSEWHVTQLNVKPVGTCMSSSYWCNWMAKNNLIILPSERTRHPHTHTHPCTHTHKLGGWKRHCFGST